MLIGRSRKRWTPLEDEVLKSRVSLQCTENDGKIDWQVIASSLPDRNNKDCRKRWHYRLKQTMMLGPWSAEEDELLRDAVNRFGTSFVTQKKGKDEKASISDSQRPSWTLVAAEVKTRNGDQCFKRWTDVLDPGLNRSSWNPQEDQLLLEATRTYGTSWKQIVNSCFPGRTGLDAKNRYRYLTHSQAGQNHALTLGDSSSLPSKSVNPFPLDVTDSDFPGYTNDLNSLDSNLFEDSNLFDSNLLEDSNLFEERNTHSFLATLSDCDDAFDANIRSVSESTSSRLPSLRDSMRGSNSINNSLENGIAFVNVISRIRETLSGVLQDVGISGKVQVAFRICGEKAEPIQFSMDIEVD